MTDIKLYYFIFTGCEVHISGTTHLHYQTIKYTFKNTFKDYLMISSLNDLKMFTSGCLVLAYGDDFWILD